MSFWVEIHIIRSVGKNKGLPRFERRVVMSKMPEQGQYFVISTPKSKKIYIVSSINYILYGGNSPRYYPRIFLKQVHNDNLKWYY